MGVSGLIGGWKLFTIAYDGTVLSEGISPVETNLSVVPGEGIMLYRDTNTSNDIADRERRYSVDFGVTWIPITEMRDIFGQWRTDLPWNEILQPVKVF